MPRLDPGDICFASLDAFSGCVASCRHAAAASGGRWAVVPTHGAMPPAVLDAKLLVLSSWARQYELILARRKGPTVPRWHSTLLQTDLCQEAAKVARLMDLLSRTEVPALAVNDHAFVEVLARDEVIHLPDVIADGVIPADPPAALDGVSVSLFGAAHWRKNLLVQSAAFNLARRRSTHGDWTLHLNGQTRRHPEYAAWLHAAGIPFVDHGWLERPRYLSLVAAMRVGLCATLCESFCYVAAEHVMLGVPVIASSAIVCLGGGVARVAADSVPAIADALEASVADRARVIAQQRDALAAQARLNAGLLQQALPVLCARAAAWTSAPRPRRSIRFRELE